jgi:hypothetical protein
MTIASRAILKSGLVSLAAAATIGIAPSAWAGCGDAALKPASYFVDKDTNLFQLANDEAGIVGMWSVTLTAPNGAPVDFGYSQWHSDGTEIMNSGGRTPAVQNFCLGVWKKTGPRSYHLNHLALDYTNGAPPQVITLTEDVTLQQGGNTFSGSFEISVGNVQAVAGQITGTRVNP